MMRTYTVILLALMLTWAPISAAMPPASVQEAAARVAVQDGGRIKPLDTYARYALLQLSGRTHLALQEGTSIPAIAWLLECMLEPEVARTREVFLVENPEVMEAVHLEHEGPRQRFSYRALVAGRPILLRLARQYGGLPAEDRTPAQKQTLQLAQNLQVFERLSTALAPLARDPAKNDETRFSDVLAQAREGLVKPENRGMANRFLVLEHADFLALIPPNPKSGAPDTWLTPSALCSQIFAGQSPSNAQVDVVRALEGVTDAGVDPPSLKAAFVRLRQAVEKGMPDSRAMRQIPREVFFYRVQPFYWALLLYVLVFLLTALCWMLPGHRCLHPIALAALALPFGLHVWGIALRCMIRARPPVSTLYETLLFVSAVAILMALVAEVIHPRKIALGIGAALGAAGLFLAGKYEAIERADTMPNLAAVLDTNFWLATHVTTVTIGYAAGLLAGALAHVFLAGKALGLRRQDPGFYQSLTQMTYGAFCFGLLFATVGTVLGGIWANESWGRFWGWDPKENGALMIVLWGLAVLHARLGGYLRDYGFNMAAVFGGVVVAYSWFGVNLLGVGLHSYGFTSGIQTALYDFYAVESALLAIGAFGWLRDQGIVRIRRSD